jgi:hypothetical protein
MVLVSTRKAGAFMTKGVYRNMFTKKNAEMEAQVMQDITDEQLDQITGGGGLGSFFPSGNNDFGDLQGQRRQLNNLFGDNVIINGVNSFINSEIQDN